MRRSTLLFVASLVIATQAFSHHYFVGYSGAPHSYGSCAASCHGTSGGTTAVSGFPAQYSPGQTYTIWVGHIGGPVLASFNAACKVGTDSITAGTLGAGVNTGTYNTILESQGVHMTNYFQDSASFTWTAPAAGTGTVRLYVAAHQDNIADGPNLQLTLLSTEVSTLPFSLTLIADQPSMRLSWNPVAGATSYRVYRAATDDVPPVPANLVATVTQTSYTDADALAQPGNKMYYVVTAVTP